MVADARVQEEFTEILMHPIIEPAAGSVCECDGPMDNGVGLVQVTPKAG